MMEAGVEVTQVECFERFPNEWVCLEITRETPGYVVAGRVVAHSEKKEDVLRAERQYRNERSEGVTYVFFAGPLVDPKANAVVVL